MTRTIALGCVALACLSWIASCGGSRGASAPTSREGATPTTTSASSTTEADLGSAEGSARAPVDEGPPPAIALRGEPERSALRHAGAPWSVAIVIENRGNELARLAPRLVLERAGDDGRFAPVESARLELRAACDVDPPPCVELAPGAALHPPAWLGTRGDAQCGCERCVPAEPGTYRFVATSCGGTHRAEGEPFELRR